MLFRRLRNKDGWWKPIFPIPWNRLIFQWKWVGGGFESIDLGIAVILVFVLFWKHELFVPKLARMLFFIFQYVFVKINVKSCRVRGSDLWRIFATRVVITFGGVLDLGCLEDILWYKSLACGDATVVAQHDKIWNMFLLSEIRQHTFEKCVCVKFRTLGKAITERLHGGRHKVWHVHWFLGSCM